MQSLAASLKTFETLRKALVNTVDTARDIVMGENYKGTFVWKKDKRDRTPAFHYTSKLVPGNRVVTDLFELFGNVRPKSMYSVVP
jgi:hypothetical protein